MTQRHAPILIALGSNLPRDDAQPIKILQNSLKRLNEIGLLTEKVSRFFATPCFPPGAGQDYVNAAAVLKTDLSAERILAVLHNVEASYGRARAKRWGGRTLDLDLIAMGDAVLPDIETWTRWRDLSSALQMEEAPDQLILPHPRLQDRAFVLVPLMDVAPDWYHPVIGKTVAQMLSALPQADIDAVRAL